MGRTRSGETEATVGSGFRWPLELRSAESAVLGQFTRAQTIASVSGIEGAVALSQADLVRYTGMSQPSVSRARESLEDDRLLVSSGSRREGRGHPTSRWQVSQDYFVVGVNLRDDFGTPGRLQGFVVTLDGRHHTHDDAIIVCSSTEVDEVVHKIAELVGNLAKKAQDQGDGAHLLGVGVSLGGHVRDGRVIRSHNLGWSDQIALNDLVGQALASENLGWVPVIVENNANSIAASLNPRGGPALYRAVVVIGQRGIGCGLVINDDVWRGDHGKAGELGHVPVSLDLASQGCICVDDGPYDRNCRFNCRCGQHGCLETVATPQAITHAVQGSDVGTRVRTIDDVNDLIQQGDSTARRVVEFAGRALGYALAGLVLSLDPECVRIEGLAPLVDESTAAGKIYLAAIQAVLKRHGFSEPLVQLETIAYATSDAMQAESALAIARDVIQRFLRDQQ